jgi:hypothetical protein
MGPRVCENRGNAGIRESIGPPPLNVDFLNLPIGSMS